MVFSIPFSFKTSLSILQSMLRYTFVFDADNLRWGTTKWAVWVKRIEKGHDEEVADIEKWVEEGGAYLKYEKEEIIHVYRSVDLMKNSMYAALVVILWAEVEFYLKRLVVICSVSLQEEEKNLFRFKDIKKQFKKKLDIDLEKFDRYKTLNAIRILNNSFKHSNGYYMSETNNPHDKIDECLLETWGIVQKNDEIDYSKLPIKDLVITCSVFLTELIGKVRQELANRIEGVRTIYEK